MFAASGDGTPEVGNGEIVWTGALPPSPVGMVYTVQVMAAERAPKQIEAEMEYQNNDMVNAVAQNAGLSPLVLRCVNLELSGLQDGRFVFSIVGEQGRTYRLQASTNLVDWVDVRTLVIEEASVVVSEVLSGDHVFYRALLLP